jgi:hypothetical protein
VQSLRGGRVELAQIGTPETEFENKEKGDALHSKYLQSIAHITFAIPADQFPALPKLLKAWASISKEYRVDY